MKNEIKNITVLGDGGWGTTLAIHLSKKGYPVTLWGPFPDYLSKLDKNRYNYKFLPGVRIPDDIAMEKNLKKAISSSDLIVFAIPSKYAAKTIKRIKGLKIKFGDKIILSVTKGFDTNKLLRISEVIRKRLGKVDLAVLSGPTIAKEVTAGLPSTAVVACADLKTAKKIQTVFNSETFRIYTNKDIVGVELGGSIKNIIAIASGVCDGLGFGTNTKAAIVTRGLAEMGRLGKALGAKPKTFSGLSGLGDLMTTCTSKQSRNRYVGEELGKGKSIKEILSGMVMVAEGVETVKAVYKIGEKHKVSIPITDEVYNIICKNKKPIKAVTDLMRRKMKSE